MKPLDRLRQQYKYYIAPKDKRNGGDEYFKRKDYYDAMRLFCIDCDLVSFAEIERMEYELEKYYL